MTDNNDDLDTDTVNEYEAETAPKKKTLLVPAVILLMGAVFLLMGWKMTHKSTIDTTTGMSTVSAPVDTSATPSPTSGENALMKAADLTDAEAAHRAEVEKKTFAPVMQAKGRFLGDPAAPVKMIEYASLTCSHCAHFHNDILDEFRVKYVDTGLVQIEFRSFPLNKPALDAAKIQACLPEDRYFPFGTMLFQTQNRWAFSSDYLTPLRQNAKLAGMSDADFDACLNDEATSKKMIDGINADVQKYKIESTPTFVINDGAAKISGAVPVAEFAKTIDPLLPVDKRPSTTSTELVP